MTPSQTSGQLLPAPVRGIWNSDTLCLILALPLGYCTSTFQVFSIDTAAFTLSDVGIILFSGLALFRAITGHRPMVWRMDMNLLLMLSFMAVILVSVVNPLVSGSRSYILQYTKSTSHFVYMWLFAATCAASVVNFRSIIEAFRWYAVCAIPINLFGIYQVPARAFDLPLAWIQYNNISIKSSDQLSLGYEGFFRATSVFSEPSSLAGFTILNIIILIVPYLMYDVRIIRNKALFYLSLYSTFVAMFLTFSLTIVAQMTVFMIAIIALSRAGSLRKIITMFAVMATLFYAANEAVSLYSSTDIFDLYFRRVASNVVGGDKVEGTVGDSFTTRAEAQKMAVSIWQQVPLTGAGFGCLYYVPAPNGERTVHVLQIYLYSLASTGILGFLSMSLFMIALCVSTIRLYLRYRARVHDVNDATILVATVPFLCMNQAAIGLSSDNLITPYYWTIIGIVIAVYYHPSLHRIHTETTLKLNAPGWLNSFLRVKGYHPHTSQRTLP